MGTSSTGSGKIIKSPEGYSAFIPNNLPPQLEWSSDLVNSLSRADFLLGKLAQEGSRLPNPHLFIRPFVTREAVLSSKIEGTRATLGEVLAANAGTTAKRESSDLQEVERYIVALDYGLKRLEELPLSLRLIREMHQRLMEGVGGSYATPGEFRRTQNWIGPPGCTLNTAKFVPPPPSYLMECLGELEIFLHNRQLPPLIHIALCHYQFEAIHPFIDGNGRIGRLLIILLLIERKMLTSPFLYLSAFFEATREEYYRQLYNVSEKGTWNDWLIYFLNGVAIQCEDVLSRAERINSLLDQWKNQFTGSSSSVPIIIIQHLTINPYFTINRISDDLKISYSTAKRGTIRLEKEGVIRKVDESKRRDKVFCAIDILKILEEPTKIGAAGQAGSF